MYRRTVGRLLVLGLLLSLAPAQGIQAQGDGGETCSALVEMALQTVGEACAGLGSNEACYGYHRVDAEFWQPRDDLAFSAPADRAPLLDLRQVSTSPLDVDGAQWGLALLNVRANVPETLPGQGALFLLMGDTTLENAVPPEEAASAATPVAAVVTAGANLRSRPTTAANVVMSVPAGTTVQLVGVNTAGDWYEVSLEGGSAWIWGELVAADDAAALAALPITDGDAPRYGPMQAFYLTTGLGEPVCREAPSALVVQSPQEVEVAFNVNGLEVALGSTLILARVSIGSGDATALVIVLLQGHLETTVGRAIVQLDQPRYAIAAAFPAFAVTLNAAGRVDAASQIVDPPGSAMAALVESACHNAGRAGFRYLDRIGCNAPLRPYRPASSSGSSGGRSAGSSSGGSAGSGGGAQPSAPSAPGRGQPSHVEMLWHNNSCEYRPSQPLANPVGFGWGLGCFDTEESGKAHPYPAVYQLYMDGAPLDMSALVQSGPHQHDPICPWGYNYYLPPQQLPPGEHTLTLVQTVLDGWQDVSGGHVTGEVSTMSCSVSIAP